MTTSKSATAAAAALVGLLGLGAAESGEKGERVYEMRVYHSPDGRLDDLSARFRNHTVKLFEKHGMTNVGYWVPLDPKDKRLIYVLSYPSREAATKSWEAFKADPEWQAVKKETEKNGPLLTFVESTFLKATDYSPEPKPSAKGDRIFELRHYTASPKNLDNLNARFRDHTVKLFEKHGMTNVAYFVPVKGEKGSDRELIYFLAHKDADAKAKSFDAFRKDPAWTAALKASEEKAGGSLTAKENGVKSTLLKATDYSPIR